MQETAHISSAEIAKAQQERADHLKRLAELFS